MYKYSCRKCPIRNRCIDESDTSPSAKDMIRNAFAARTDTLATWGVLQKNCLLIKAEEKRARMANEESLLTRRLREIREAKEQSTQEPGPATVQPPDYLKPVPPPLSARTEPLGRNIGTDELSSQPSRSELPVSRLERKRITRPVNPRWFTVIGSSRHIALPVNGELVLGRFDPHLGVPPDVDLAYEDWERQTVSRRHAKIVGVEGYHTIEDLGSRNGVGVNGRRLGGGPSPELQPGDRVTIGGLELVYDTRPTSLLTGPGPHDRHVLVVTPTGRKVVIAPPREIVIGRADRYVDFSPDVDLSVDGDVSMRVSRRHAVITWRQMGPYLEDLGSGFGTRLNGEPLLIGQAVPLNPGDHFWLGGCVVAYDIEV